jgi:hypothetical protein
MFIEVLLEELFARCAVANGNWILRTAFGSTRNAALSVQPPAEPALSRNIPITSPALLEEVLDP